MNLKIRLGHVYVEEFLIPLSIWVGIIAHRLARRLTFFVHDSYSKQWFKQSLLDDFMYQASILLQARTDDFEYGAGMVRTLIVSSFNMSK